MVELCKLAKVFATKLKIYRFSDIDMEKVMRIAIDNSITVYDATYIALAQTVNDVLATEDSDILQTSSRYGIKTMRLADILKLF